MFSKLLQTKTCYLLLAGKVGEMMRDGTLQGVHHADLIQIYNQIWNTLCRPFKPLLLCMREGNFGWNLASQSCLHTCSITGA